MFDTHAHVNFKDFRDDYREVIDRALSNHTKVINVGSQLSTSQRAVNLANEYPEDIYAAVGIHPVHLSDKVFKEKVDESEEVEFRPRYEEYKKEDYLELAKDKKTVAIGEIGLDYFHNEENKKTQKEIFQEQIDLAQELNLPIIIHCRNAHKDVLEILTEKKKQYGKRLRGVVHCFSGRLSQAERYIEKDFLLGFNGVITFARDYDKVLKSIDLKYLLLETDCPYLTPASFRGKRNEPLYVKYVAEKIAEVKEIGFDEVEKVTDENVEKLLGV